MNSRIVKIPLPLAHVGSVNAWVVLGDPLTLVDTGLRDAAALAALEDGLGAQGLRIEDIELVLVTHHLDDAEKADRVVALVRGRIVADGRPTDVLSALDMLS